MSDKEIIDWTDPSDEKVKYFALSVDTGHYWTEDPDDPLIVDVTELPIKHEVEDTIRQIAEKYKMGKGKQYERRNLFEHYDPKEHAWLVVEKLPNGTRDPDTNKVNRDYQAYWSRKFKLVSCISRITGRCQGNPAMQNKEYARSTSAKAKAERKRKLANAQDTARRLHFDPLKRLALYAMGDSERLGLREEVKQSIQMKALETFLKYSHQQMKPYSPQEMERLKGADTGPRINIILPSDGSEDEKHVITHKDQQSLEQYLKTGHSAYDGITSDWDDGAEEIDKLRLDLPDEDE